MVNIRKGTIEGYKELPVSYNLLSSAEGSKKLVILFPGAGYTTQAPLFHYSTGIFLKRSFDVLEVNYNYKSEAYSNAKAPELIEAIKHDVKTVIDKVLEDSSYEDFYIIGKSLGTIAMEEELKRPAFKLAKAIWLTPLLNRDEVFISMATSHHTGLCILGDQDPFYLEERFNKLQNNPNLTFNLIKGTDHSLEYPDDVLGSIDALKQVMEEIGKF